MVMERLKEYGVLAINMKSDDGNSSDMQSCVKQAK